MHYTGGRNDNQAIERAYNVYNVTNKYGNKKRFNKIYVIAQQNRQGTANGATNENSNQQTAGGSEFLEPASVAGLKKTLCTTPSWIHDITYTLYYSNTSIYA